VRRGIGGRGRSARVSRARMEELIANIGTIFGAGKFVSVLAFHNFPTALPGRSGLTPSVYTTRPGRQKRV